MLTGVLLGGLVGVSVLLGGRAASTRRLRVAVRDGGELVRAGGELVRAGGGMVRAGGGMVRAGGGMVRAGGGMAGGARSFRARAERARRGDPWWPDRGRGRRTPPLDVAGLADRVAALSRAGLPWIRVWGILAGTPGPAQPVCAAVARHLDAGGTAAQGLAALAGPTELGWLAVACDIAERAGAPVADVLERFATAVRADAASAADRDAALAGPRATATVLSWLPLGGLGLGVLVGADPLVTVVGTAAGRICAVAGVGTWMLGRWWFRFLVRRAERAAA